MSTLQAKCAAAEDPPTERVTSTITVRCESQDFRHMDLYNAAISEKQNSTSPIWDPRSAKCSDRHLRMRARKTKLETRGLPPGLNHSRSQSTTILVSRSTLTIFG